MILCALGEVGILSPTQTAVLRTLRPALHTKRTVLPLLTLGQLGQQQGRGVPAWVPNAQHCRPVWSPLSWHYAASLQMSDLWTGDLSRTENGDLWRDAEDACAFTTFPEDWLASLPCISLPTEVCRNQSVSVWSSDPWWFIWGSPAKRS